MKLALDSNVFNSKRFCKWLLNSGEEKYLPAVAYMEYLYHNLKKRKYRIHGKHIPETDERYHRSIWKR